MEVNNSISVPNFSNVLPDFNNNVVTDQSLKEDVNATISHADNNVMDDSSKGGGLSVYA